MKTLRTYTFRLCPGAISGKESGPWSPATDPLPHEQRIRPHGFDRALVHDLGDAKCGLRTETPKDSIEPRFRGSPLSQLTWRSR